MCYGTAEKIVTLYYSIFQKGNKMASPLNAAHQNLPFPPNQTLPSKANAINQACTKSSFFQKY